MPNRSSEGGAAVKRLCGRRTKYVYPSETAAEQALADVRAERSRPKRDTHKVEQSTYRCDRCQGWHLTSQAKETKA